MNLLVVDLDGTITKSDNLIRFSYYMIIKERKTRFFIVFPLLFLLKFKIISNIQFKVYYTGLILKNLSESYLRNCAQKLILSEPFQKDINTDIIKYLDQQIDTEKIILSANYDFIVDCIAQLLKIETCISINPEIKDGKYTGIITGQIPYGKNKINSLSEYITNKSYTTKIGLADSKSDIPFLIFLDTGYLIAYDKKSGKTQFIDIC